MASKKSNFILSDKPNPPQNITDSMFFGINLDEKQKSFVEDVWKRNKKIYLVNSKAGTGKTLVSVATGVIMTEYGFYEKMVYVTFPGIYEKTQGFLPGDLIEKSDPYFQPLRNALLEINKLPDAVCDTNPMAVKNGSAFISCAVSTYMRGINIKNSFVIIDEAQNADIETLTKVISRISDDCVCIIIGHSGQCDMYDKSKSGFTACIDYYTKYRPDICAKYDFEINHRGEISQLADKMLQEYKKPSYGFIALVKNRTTNCVQLVKHIREGISEDIDDSWFIGDFSPEDVVRYGYDNYERLIVCDCHSKEELVTAARVLEQYKNTIGDIEFFNLLCKEPKSDSFIQLEKKIRGKLK